MKKKIDNKAFNILDILYKKYFGRNIFLFAMGMLISSFAINLFFEKYTVIPTGSSGLAFLISRVTNIDLSLATFLVCLFIFVIAFLYFGWKFSFKMIPVTIFSPIFIKATTLITDHIDLDNTSLFLIMVIAGVMQGFSVALIRKSGFHPGGFGVLCDILKRKFYVGLGTSNTILNVILIGSSVFIFGLDKAIYSIISLLVSSYVVDKVLIGISNNKAFYIITDKPLEIRDYVMEKLHYSITLIKARGGYSNKRKKMLMCVVPTIEYLKLKELVSEIDSNAFFLIVDLYDSSVKKNCKNM